jgi:hypothetical protein
VERKVGRSGKENDAQNTHYRWMDGWREGGREGWMDGLDWIGLDWIALDK